MYGGEGYSYDQDSLLSSSSGEASKLEWFGPGLNVNSKKGLKCYFQGAFLE